MATTEAERKRSKVAGALAGFRMGKAPDRSGEKQVGDEALTGAAPQPSKWDRVKQVLWDSNLNAPIRGAYNLMNADPYTLMTDTGAAGQQAAADSFDAAGGVTVGSMPMPKPSNALTMGIKAYHGSPHSFDKFSMDKIGTGEGAQAYGHGLYFAENEGVAQGYKRNVTTQQNSTGKTIDGIAVRLLRAAPRMSDDELAKVIRETYPKIQEEDIAGAVSHARNMPSGSVYEVNIDADPNAFLDWDKPLSEQPQNVQAVLGSGNGTAATRLGHAYKNEMFGGDIVGKDRATPAEVSRALAEKGIPGIKYLDAGSRGAGDGTRNYVVFDDKLVSIVKKYGIAGASAMLGYNVLDGVTNAQAEELKKASGGGRIGGLAKQNQEQPNAD